MKENVIYGRYKREKNIENFLKNSLKCEEYFE